MKKWKKLNEKDIIKNNIFTLKSIACHNEKKNVDHNFNIIETHDWINIVPVTTEGKIVMVKQHRLGTDEITLETPGGLCNPGEPPAESARRELLEETGYKAENISMLKNLRNNPAIMNNNIYYFMAEGCVKTDIQCLDEAEDIEVIEHSVKEVKDMLASGEISHSIVVLALMLYFENIS